MRIYHVYPHISVAHIDDLHCRVVMDFENETVTIQQPRHFGGKQVFDMDAYTIFEGDIRDFVKHIREHGDKQILKDLAEYWVNG